MKEQNEEQLEKLLKSLAEEAQPDKKFEMMLQQKLKEQFAEKHGSTAQTGNVSSFFMRLLKFKLQFTTALILVLFTSTTIYAYESDAVTNGHILYPLKRTAEKVEEIFANSPEEKSDYYHKMAKRRISELETLEKKGSSDEETVAEAETMLTYAEAELGNIPEKIQPALSDSPQLETAEMAAPQIMMEEPPKNKREIKKEEILKTREEFKEFKEKIENQNNEPGKNSKKEILKNRFNKKTEKEMSETQTLETEMPPNPKTPQQPIPQPVSGPYAKPPKLPKMEYGETSVIKIHKDQLESPILLPPSPLKPLINPKKEKPEFVDPMIPTI